jgi:hypothetical protein
MKNPTTQSRKGLKNPYDTTSSRRQGTHLARLAETSGKRTVVDLDGPQVAALTHLVATGYGTSRSGAIRRAIDEAYVRVEEGREGAQNIDAVEGTL